jgi:hypothetical protein
MKAIKISEQIHANLTSLVGQLIAETGTMKTYEDAIEALLHRSVVLPSELLREIENFIERNQQLGYATKEEFLKESARWLMTRLAREHRAEAESNEESVDGGEQARLS